MSVSPQWSDSQARNWKLATSQVKEERPEEDGREAPGYIRQANPRAWRGRLSPLALSWSSLLLEQQMDTKGE